MCVWNCKCVWVIFPDITRKQYNFSANLYIPYFKIVHSDFNTDSVFFSLSVVSSLFLCVFFSLLLAFFRFPSSIFYSLSKKEENSIRREKNNIEWSKTRRYNKDKNSRCVCALNCLSVPRLYVSCTAKQINVAGLVLLHDVFDIVWF